jgi:hypothetical protein
MQGASAYVKQYAPSVQEFISLCLELAQEFSDGNLFTVYLEFKRTILESLISGDASMCTWLLIMMALTRTLLIIS